MQDCTRDTRKLEPVRLPETERGGDALKQHPVRHVTI